MEKNFEIMKTPKVFGYRYNEFITNDLVLKELIDNFVFVLEDKLSNENLQLLYKNLCTLKVNNRNIIYELVTGLFKDNTVTGKYYLDDNTISIVPLKSKKILSKCIGIDIKEYIANLYHELLHMASSITDKKNDVAYSGLSQIKHFACMGVSLDDGYTEILLSRYFNIDEEYISYDYEIIIASLIEKIVSDNRMTYLYFTADFYGLVEELQKYNNKENILKFFNNLDFVYVLQDHIKSYKEDIIYYHNEVSRFIVDTYINKLNNDIEVGLINRKQYDIRLDECINDLHRAFEILEWNMKKERKK